MVLIERIVIRNYRRLRDLSLEIRPLTVMIGANSVGKTSLLEALSLLAASASGRLQKRLIELGGLSEIVTRARPGENGPTRVEIEVNADVSGYGPLDYALHLGHRGVSNFIARESLAPSPDTVGGTPIPFFTSENGYTKRFNGSEMVLMEDHNPQESFLSQISYLDTLPRLLQETLASCAFYGPIEVGARAPVRLPQMVVPTALPGANGEDLISCLYFLRENHPERFAVVEDTLASAFPDFERLNFPPIAAGMVTLTWKDRHYTQPIYLHQLSEGTLRFLWLTALLLSPELPEWMLLDEPEISLHPELLRLLTDLLRDAAHRTRLLVATHSDRLIGFLKPEETLVFDSEDGYARATWADTLDLDHWLADYRLDEIWEMGRIGGRA